MKYVLVLLALLYSTKAYADTPPCYLAKQAMSVLTAQGYLPRVEGEIEGHPMMILVHPKGDWIALVRVDEAMVCEMAHGRAWNEIKWRKA